MRAHTQTHARRRASTDTALTEELARTFASVATELAKLRAEVDSSVVKQRRLAEQAAALPAVAAVGLSPGIRRRAHGAAAELVSGGGGAGGGGAGGGGAGGGTECPPLSGNAIFYHVGARAPSEHVCIAETFYDIFVRHTLR